MSRYEAAQVLNRVSGQVVLVADGRENEFLSNLQELRARSTSRADDIAAALHRNVELAGMYGYGAVTQDKPFAYADGIAIIPVHGTLINRYSGSWGYVTGYNFIRAQLNAALDDEDVKVIVFDVNSLGGEVAGCWELCADIYASRAVKPSISVVDAFSMSAGFAVASSATKMVCTPSGSVGSIGVLCMHVDISAALEQDGYKITLIFRGAHKVDGNSFEALPANVKADMQASIDKRYGEFCDLVVLNRGLDSQAVRETESRQYQAGDAAAINLIDAVQTPTEAVSEFLAELGSDDPNDIEEDNDMLTAEQIAAYWASPEGIAKAAEIASAASATAVTAEKARMTAITGHEEAKDRPALAAHLANNTAMSVDEVAGILKASAKETKPAPAAAATPANPLDKAIEATGGSPTVGEGAGTDAEAVKPNRAVAAMARAGVPLKLAHKAPVLVARK